jgi:hypothetical protein
LQFAHYQRFYCQVVHGLAWAAKAMDMGSLTGHTERIALQSATARRDLTAVFTATAERALDVQEALMALHTAKVMALELVTALEHKGLARDTALEHKGLARDMAPELKDTDLVPTVPA